MLSGFGVNATNKHSKVLSEYLTTAMQNLGRKKKARIACYNSHTNNIESVSISFKCFTSLYLTNN